ncbi:hypothetical protein [Christiangramia forsetii]|uniref:Membrane protein n=2 Tax=Christiangramia forsetii TaxID=411153 RepID=A0LYL1_CHRFK|nr:hypothetical protein [Christiangramia forsetii]CAL65456.1 membrane protein [Christiangramia forsetii KT0803]
MKFWLNLLMGFLIAANFLAIYFLDEYVDRWFRFGATFLFLLIYILKYFSNYRLLFIFLLLALCDGLLVYYEIPFLKKIIYTVRILAYLNIILLIAPSLSKLKLNLFTVLISIFIITIDIYLLHEMAKSLPKSDQNPIFIILFYLLGITSLAIAAVSMSYLNRYANKAGFYLVIVSFGLILSDIFFYNAYYLDFEEFYYLDRLANIIAISFLLAFGSTQKITGSEANIS